MIDNVYDDPDGVALLPGVTVHHMDLWRLPEGKIRQLVDLPHVFTECVSLIEWPERLGDELTPAAHLDVHLAIVGGDGALAPEAEAEAAAASDEEQQEEEEDDDMEDDEDDEPRIATLTARGAVWEQRLEEMASGLG